MPITNECAPVDIIIYAEWMNENEIWGLNEDFFPSPANFICHQIESIMRLQ